MEAILIRPKNKEQLVVLKAFAKALNMDFETMTVKSQYNSKFVKQILDADKSAKKRNVTRIKDAKNIWEDIL